VEENYMVFIPLVLAIIFNLAYFYFEICYIQAIMKNIDLNIPMKALKEFCFKIMVTFYLIFISLYLIFAP
jgi:hypothetical protein